MKQRLLLVDDDDSTLLVMGRVLEGDGYDVDTSVDAASALAKLGETSYAALITDLVMPGMTGVELVHLVHAAYASTKCIIISGHAPTEATPGVAWLLKPISADALLMTVRTTLATAVS